MFTSIWQHFMFDLIMRENGREVHRRSDAAQHTWYNTAKRDGVVVCTQCIMEQPAKSQKIHYKIQHINIARAT